MGGGGVALERGCQICVTSFTNCFSTGSRFNKSYNSCYEAFKSGGINPEPGSPVTILLTSGSVVQCAMENIEEGNLTCPEGWYGNMDRGLCFKVKIQAVDNEEACR